MEELIEFDRWLLLQVNGSTSLYLDGVVRTLTTAATWIPLYIALFFLVMRNNSTMRSILVLWLRCVFNTHIRHRACFSLFGHLLRFQFEGHILVEFLGQKQIQIIVDTHIRIRLNGMTVLLAPRGQSSHSYIQFFTCFN